MRISVVIPFYNLERYARECLDSVVAAFSRLEPGSAEVKVICVDDGSTDSTPSLLDGFASAATAEHGLVVRVVHKPNGGEGSARNAGLEVATGEWVTFLDGDDVWLPNMLEEALPLLSGHAAADIVNLRFAPFEDGAAVPCAQAASGASAMDLREEIPDCAILGVGVYPTFFRMKSLGGVRFSALPLGADRLYVAQCLSRAETVVMSDAVVHGYRVRAGSMARAATTVLKVNSECDYVAGALAALAESGRGVGRRGAAHLASLWLSDLPARMRRLSSRDARMEAARHWIASWNGSAGRLLFGRRRLVHRVLKMLAGRPAAALELAHAVRALGIV